MRRPRTAIAALAAGLGLAAAAPARGDEVIGVVDRPTMLSAHAGNVAWSAYDPATGAYRLVLSVDGKPPEPVAVAPRGVPFDVDLGPVRDTGVHAVYSRCAREPAIDRAGEPLPAYNTGAGCDIHRVELATGNELRVTAASTPGASEYLPSLWRRRVAFARRFEARPGVRGVRPNLYVARRFTERPSRRLRAGPRTAGERRGSRFERTLAAGQPLAIDLRGRTAAVLWQAGAARRLSSLRPGAASVLSRGALLPGPLHAGRSVIAAAGGELVRVSAATGRVLARRALPDGRVLAVAADRSAARSDATYVLLAPAGGGDTAATACPGGCRVVRLAADPLGG